MHAVILATRYIYIRSHIPRAQAPKETEAKLSFVGDWVSGAWDLASELTQLPVIDSEIQLFFADAEVSGHGRKGT